MKNKIVLFIFCLLVWVFLNWKPDYQHLIVGVFAAGLVSFFIGDLFTRNPHMFTHLHRYLWFLCYILIFAWECVKANFDVALRVVHPKVPLNPGIVKVKTELTSNVALTFLANSITLTPGTLTVDIDKDKKVLFIHWIDVSRKEKQTRRIVERFERILRRIFE